MEGKELNSNLAENLGEDEIAISDGINKIDVKDSIEAKKNIFYLMIKRIVDIICGIIGVIFLIPITLVVVIVRLINKENDGPIFYEQLRIGKNGKQFRMYKYRSMVMGADEKLEKYLLENQEARIEYETYKKLKDDPRVTKVGKFLRETSLDEWPQFLNLLGGSMTLIRT